MNKFVQSIVDRIRRSGSEEEHDWFYSDSEPTHSARPESRLAGDRVEKLRRGVRFKPKTIDDLPVLGAAYPGILSVSGTNQLAGFVLIYDGVHYEVRFEDVLEPFLHAPKGVSYSQAMGNYSDRFSYEGMMINYLRQVLHIHYPEDPLLSTVFRNLDAPIKLGHPSGETKYIPLSDADNGLIVGMLSSCFRQMREGRWY